jgi:hypothetical protein
MKRYKIGNRAFQVSQSGAAEPACSQVGTGLSRAPSGYLSVDKEQNILIRQVEWFS